MKLKFRLTPTLIVLISAVLMLSYAGYELARERAEAIARAELQTQNYARVLEEHARQTLHRVGAHLAQSDAALVSMRPAGGFNVAQAQLLLTQLLPTDRLIENVLLLGGNGALLHSTKVEQSLGYDVGVDSDYFAPHVRGADRELVFGSPVKAADGQWLLPVSRRLGTAGGTLDGVLVAMVRAAYFQDFYDSIERGPDGLVTLFLSSGSAVVTSPTAEAVIGKNWSHSPMFRQHLPAWPTGTVRQVVVKDGVDRIYSYRALNDYPVVVTYGLSMATILASWQESAWNHGLMLLAALGMLAGAAVLLQGQEALRRAANKELKDSELHLRSIIEAEPECIKMVDAQGILLQMNPAGLAMIEADALNQVAGQPVLDLIAPEYRGAFNQMHQRVLAGETVELAFEVLGLKGGRRWLETHAVPMQYRGETVQLAVTRDVTDRKCAEMALQESEERYRTAFKTSRELINISRMKDGCYLDVNDEFTRLTGWTKEEAIGKTSIELKIWRNAGDRQRIVDILQRDGFCENLLIEFVARSGRISTGLFSATVMTFKGEQCLFSVTRDITERREAEKFLELTNKRMSALIEAIPDAVFFKDSEGRWLITNESAKQLFQLNAIPWEGKNELELADLHPEFRAAHQTCLVDDEKAWQTKGMSLFAETVTDTEGYNRHFEVRKIPVFDEHGGRQSLIILGRDITEHKQAEEALRIAATAFESQQGIAITNARRVILRVNKAFTAITGYSAEEAVGKTPSILASGRHDRAYYAAMTQALETTGAWQGEIWNRRKNEEIYPEWLTISAVKDTDGLTTHYVATFQDVSERVSAQAQIDTLAFYDPLTLLPNRRLLLDRLEQALHLSTRHTRQNALLFVDLDNFKTLNDTLGHSQGDALLVQVAQRLKTCVREGDTVARLGSDEFVVMLEDLSEDEIEAGTQAETVGEKILDAFVPVFSIDSSAHHSTPSIGITLFGGAVMEGRGQPLKRSELAMFQAKAAGRNTLRLFDAQMQAKVSAHAAMEADLREAVAKQQFLLHYQPQIVGAGRITGVEALVRWQHPLRGMVSPAQFIPLAEESGLILPIGQWVLETACAQLAAWSSQPELAHLTMAVNVSARQFKQSNFVDSVLAILECTQATPKLLKLELTESMLVDDVEAIISKMGVLKAHGICFSLDDFGTGYSSLTYLKRLPLDQLKIDQGFIRNIVTDSNDSAIAKMVVVLAESLGLSVIAEGVELQAQADFLAHLGCHAYQGYLFSRPLPLAAFESLI
jgi:diguanylate cyclase (GGDEF)-like protein/PAS domain S-box-containing protein